MWEYVRDVVTTGEELTHHELWLNKHDLAMLNYIIIHKWQYNCLFAIHYQIHVINFCTVCVCVCVFFFFFQSTCQWHGEHFPLFISRSHLLHDRPLVCSCTTSFCGLFPGSSSPQHCIPIGTQSTDTFIRLCHCSGALCFNGNTDTHGSSLIRMTLSIMDFCDWSRLVITAVMQNAALWTYSISTVTEFTFHFNIRLDDLWLTINSAVLKSQHSLLTF